MDESADGGDSCPICFCHYTSTGNHRIVSLKCGHLFGQNCILDWYGKQKTAACPVCGVKSPKSQMRVIFSSKIIVMSTDAESKLLDKYLMEVNKNKIHMEEIAKLKTEIDVLRLDKIKDCDCLLKNVYVNKTFELYKKFKLNIDKRSLVEYDCIGGYVVMSTVKMQRPEIYKYLNDENMGHKTFSDTGYISNMQVHEGNVICSIDCVVYTISLYNLKTIHRKEFKGKVTSIERSEYNPDLLFVGDETGSLTVFCFSQGESVINICKNAIHSIVIAHDVIYVGTVYAIYQVKSLSSSTNWFECTKVVSELKCHISKQDLLDREILADKLVCTNIFGESDKLVVAYRLGDNRMVHYCTNGGSEMVLHTGCVQYKRYKEKYHNNFLYLVDQYKSKIQVLDINFSKVCAYEVQEDIVNFCVHTGHLVIISDKYIYMYK